MKHKIAPLLGLLLLLAGVTNSQAVWAPKYKWMITVYNNCVDPSSSLINNNGQEYFGGGETLTLVNGLNQLVYKMPDSCCDTTALPWAYLELYTSTDNGVTWTGDPSTQETLLTIPYCKQEYYAWTVNGASAVAQNPSCTVSCTPQN